MDSSGFLLLVKNFTALTGGECEEVNEFSKKYPYSQVLHFLNARAANDLKHGNKAALLNQSAIYCTDRSVLKWVMSTPRIERVREPVLAQILETQEIRVEDSIATPPILDRKPAERTIEKPEQLIPQSAVSSYQETSLSGDALLNDIYTELEKLKKSKHNFEVSLDEFQKSSRQGNEQQRTFKSLQDRGSDPSSDPLIEEIKVSKKKFKVDNPRQKEQNEIIDQFIKTQPVIHKVKPSEQTNDLSEDVGNFSDNIVSETLVDILVKQGKKDKAIEVLKKLIWKFPQKKAYFAAQIEDLKN